MVPRASQDRASKVRIQRSRTARAILWQQAEFAVNALSLDHSQLRCQWKIVLVPPRKKMHLELKLVDETLMTTAGTFYG